MENPFSTAFVRPGSLPFLFSGGEDVGQVVERLRAAGWRGQITGRHGAGKSTLLHTLAPALERAGRSVRWFTLRNKQRRLNPPAGEAASWSGNTQVIVDGYEQLSWWSRWRLNHSTARAGAGLLVTAHASVKLPTLMHVDPSLATAQRVVAELLAQAPSELADTPDSGGIRWTEAVEQCFLQHNGNTREMLFSLYDLFEQQRLKQI